MATTRSSSRSTPRRAAGPRVKPRTGTRRPTVPSVRRRQPQQSTGRKILSAIGNAIPAAGAGKAASKAARKPPKGALLLAGAGGLAAAVKNRDKLTGLFGKSKQQADEPAFTEDVTQGSRSPQAATSPNAVSPTSPATGR